jgi:ADP-glucose pyrophosphorylase
MTKGMTAPFDPLMNIENDQTFSKKGSIFRERDVKIDKSAQLKNVIIGSGSVIGDVVLTNTIVGRNCSIQSGVVVEDSILWDKVTLNSGSKIHQSVIANDNELSMQLGLRTVLPPKTQVSASSDNITFTVYGHTPVETEDSDDEPEQIPIGTQSLELTNDRFIKSDRL